MYAYFIWAWALPEQIETGMPLGRDQMLFFFIRGKKKMWKEVDSLQALLWHPSTAEVVTHTRCFVRWLWDALDSLTNRPRAQVNFRNGLQLKENSLLSWPESSLCMWELITNFYHNVALVTSSADCGSGAGFSPFESGQIWLLLPRVQLRQVSVRFQGSREFPHHH